MTTYEYNGEVYDNLEDCLSEILWGGAFADDFVFWVNDNYTAYELLEELSRRGEDGPYLDFWHDFVD